MKDLGYFVENVSKDMGIVQYADASYLTRKNTTAMELNIVVRSVQMNKLKIIEELFHVLDADYPCGMCGHGDCTCHEESLREEGCVIYTIERRGDIKIITYGKPVPK